MKHGDIHRNFLVDGMFDNMVTTVHSFPVSSAVLDINQPPQPYPDDPERLKDRHTFTDDPHLQALLELGSDKEKLGC